MLVLLWDHAMHQSTMLQTALNRATPSLWGDRFLPGMLTVQWGFTPFPFWLDLVDNDAVSTFLLGWSEVVDDSMSQRSSQSNVMIQLQPEPRVNRRLQQERSLKSQQDWQCYLSTVPSQEATGGLNKRSHSRDSREMAVRGKGNYVLTGESQHKASSLYTTTCGYVEQTQSKMETMTMHHMIGSSVAHDGEQGNM